MAGPLIDFVCAAAAHQPRREGPHPSTVTIHQGRWAYCDSVDEQDHEWIASGGIPLDVLRLKSAGEVPQHAS